MGQGKSDLVDPEVGLYLGGEAVEDREFRGQHPLFYGVVRFSGGRRFNAYVKLLNARGMYAEVLSAALGRALGLPIPYTTIVVARGAHVGINAEMVHCLASVDTQALPISRVVRIEEVNELLNKWTHRYLAPVFDELIANPDRNLRNLLYSGSNKLWLIDHEEALGEPLSRPGRKITNHLLQRLLENLDGFMRRRGSQMVMEKSQVINTLDFRAHALRGLPGNCRVDAAHVDQVVEFLQERLHHIPDLIGNAVDPTQLRMEYPRE